MTTICANRKTMAADTQVSMDGAKYHAVKIFRIGDSIIGAAGNAANCNIFIEWFRLGKPTEKPELTGEDDDKNVTALELNPRGLFVYNGITEPDTLTDKFYAIGSGGSLALAGMDVGKSPADAVRLAHRHDPGTGAAVTEMSLPSAEKRPRKTKAKAPAEIKGTDA